MLASRRLEGGPRSEGPGATRSAARRARAEGRPSWRRRRCAGPCRTGRATGPIPPSLPGSGRVSARRLPAAHARHIPAGRRGARPRLLRRATARGPSGRRASAPPAGPGARAPRGAGGGVGVCLLTPPSVPHTNYGAMGSGCSRSRPRPRRCPAGPRGHSPQNPRGALSCGAGLKAWALSSEFRCHHREL